MNVIRCETSDQMQAVVKRRYLYGTGPAGRRDIHDFCRIQACAIAASFDRPTSLFRVGDPISEFADATHGGNRTARLSGSGPTAASERMMCRARPAMCDFAIGSAIQ